MRITLTANTDWYLFNFRLDLARALRARGDAVSLVCPDGDYAERLGSEGFVVRTFTAPTNGFSIRQNRRALKQIELAYRELRPDLVHLFTPVCVLLGGIAASRVGVPKRVAALTGLGHVFTSNSLKARLARPVLRRLFRRELRRPGTAVVFQNEGDRMELVAAGVVDASRSHLIRGSGVDVERFRPRQEVLNQIQDDGKVRVVILFASRLLGEKGLKELAAAFRQVRQAHPAAELWVAGEPYAANPTSLTSAELDAIGREPGITLLGQVEDMPGLLRKADIVALPSYREGTPKILLEAAACGLPIVATDIPGCRGIVEDGESGFLVPVRDVDQLAEALGTLMGDETLRARFGVRGRSIMERDFGSESVIARTLEVYARL